MALGRWHEQEVDRWHLEGCVCRWLAGLHLLCACRLLCVVPHMAGFFHMPPTVFGKWGLEGYSWVCCALSLAFVSEPSSYWLLLHNCCSVAKSCPTLWDIMDCSMPGFPVLHHLLDFAQTRVHGVSDAIQPSHPLFPPSPPAQSFPASGLHNESVTYTMHSGYMTLS